MTEKNPSQGIALVTGAAKRIGRAIAHGLARVGWDVAIHYHRSETDAETLRGEIIAAGRRAITLSADLANPAEVETLIQRCAGQLGAPTCLVNNASMFSFDEISSVTAAQWDAMHAVNLRAPIILSRDFAKHLPAGVEGNIINLLDQKIANLNPDFFSYTISKVGLDAATHTLAMALAPRIRVNAVAPGLTLVSGDQTPENFTQAHRMTPLGRAGKLDDIVAAVLFLLNAQSVTGQTIFIDGGQRLMSLDRDVMYKVQG
jgi:NAD(P)-dependent dehydrogenase (short-subunit alcohol dehydrogenase family)